MIFNIFSINSQYAPGDLSRCPPGMLWIRSNKKWREGSRLVLAAYSLRHFIFSLRLKKGGGLWEPPLLPLYFYSHLMTCLPSSMTIRPTTFL